LLVLDMAAFMVQADARVIDPLLHVIARDFGTTPPSAAIVTWRSSRSARSPARSSRASPSSPSCGS